MNTTQNSTNEPKPMGFGKTLLASTLGFIIGSVVLSIITFIITLAALFSALSSVDDSKPISGTKLAVELNLTGTVSETSRNELMSFFENRSGCSIDQLLTAINEAATDKRVKALYLHLGGGGLDWAQAEELQLALKDFHSRCEKPVIAYGEMLSQPEYFLATAADKIAVHPSGIIEFSGLGAEVMYYKGLLDKLGVHMELIRPVSCAYKSAGEVYTRTDMSDANREQVRSYISSVWNHALDVMSANRGLSREDLNTAADNLTGFLPDDALKAKMVDTLCFEQDIKAELKARYGATRLVKAKRYAENVSKKAGKERIAVIYAEGEVVPGKNEGTRSGVYGDDIVKAFDDAVKDDKVKAIVLRVNSPGGAVTASESMTHAVREAKKVKPVVVSMSGLAASAGYEISWLRQKLGITTDTVKTNSNSTAISLYRPLSPAARALMQKNVEDFYITFTQRVADGRGLSRQYVDSIARGRVWTGKQAKELGLVDTLGGLPLALRIAAEEAGVKIENCSVVTFPAEKSMWEQLMQQMDESQEEELRARLSAVIPFYNELEQWSRMEPLQARLPFVIKIN